MLEFVYFFGLLVLALYMQWAPHELYLGFCLEIFLLTVAGIIKALLLYIKYPSQRNNFSWAGIFFLLFSLWFIFIFSLAANGIAILDDRIWNEENNIFMLFSNIKEYAGWIILDLLLLVNIKESANKVVERLFAGNLFVIIRLFPNAFIALLLAAVPLPANIKIILFICLLAFPYYEAAKYFSRNDSYDENEFRIGILKFISKSFVGLVVLVLIAPFILAGGGFIIAGVVILYNGNSVITAAASVIFGVSMLFFFKVSFQFHKKAKKLLNMVIKIR